MDIRKLALVGNPNTGKSSLFNQLTGLRQKVGNFPGVTVERKTGSFRAGHHTVEVIDLPGTYSIYPRSKDEKVVYDLITEKSGNDFPDLFVVVADMVNLERNLLLLTQLYDAGLPLILVLTMEDIAAGRSIHVDSRKLSTELSGIPVVVINARTGRGVTELKKTIVNYKDPLARKLFGNPDFRSLIKNYSGQAADAENRFARIRELLISVENKKGHTAEQNFTTKLDRILVHPVWGYLIFIGLLFIIFQFIFHFATLPMDWIDQGFLELSQYVKTVMPEGVFTDLLAEGIIPGIGGVLVFIPQITLLFFFLAILEETGYMSRVVFIMDRLVRPFGLNGKSVVPLMSSVACAIPGIMATRNISSWKDRLITIMVAPLMSCSARIPVYTLLIALVIPATNLWGIFNLQGLVLLALYALGLVSALLVAAVMKWMMKTTDDGFLIMELPGYKLPRMKHVGIHLWEKVRIFIFDAGKVILAISILLWALASYGPGRENSYSDATAAAVSGESSFIARTDLENSYIGILGKWIEPVIRPLGYDWKIGISLITSFAAREVFVGSMATIYSVGEDFEENEALIDRLRNEKKPGTNTPVYTLATGMSLMVFYAYAMQCMATFAVVKRETASWKWPFIQVIYMGILAYIMSFVAFNIFN